MKASVVSLLVVFGLGLMVADANASLPNEYERISLASITDAALEERVENNDMPAQTQVASNDRQSYYVYNSEPAQKSEHQSMWVAAISLLLLVSMGIMHHFSLRAVARSAAFTQSK